MATYAFLCPTPKQHCSGTLAKLNGSLDKNGYKKHGTAKESMKCYENYLIRVKGCSKLSSREFRHPDGPIEILNKEHSFGCRLRAGKRGEGSSIGKANRGMPQKHAAVISA